MQTPRRSPILVEPLETRRLLSAASPTNLEQYVVELINRGRLNPGAEAARYNVALNEGLPAGTISTAAKQPLAINPYLNDGARSHSRWMLDHNTFSHTGANGSSPGDRMSAAGYSFIPPWNWGENIAWQSFNGSGPSASLVAGLHKALFVDAGIADRGHRTNLMSPSFREIGPGFLSGPFKGFGNAGMLTTDFANSSGNPFLTGVVYRDTVTKDNFYTPGEGLGDVTITATRLFDNAWISTTSFSSGGYSLRLPAGTYRVTASGGSLPQTMTLGSVSIGSANVKEDFVAGAAVDPPPPPPPTDTIVPVVELTQALRKRSASKYHNFAVTYTDDKALNGASYDNFDVVVTGPRGFSRYAVFNSGDRSAGTSRVISYIVRGPGGSWDASDNGVYTLTLQGNQVADAAGNKAALKTLGTFSVKIPAPTSTTVPPPGTRVPGLQKPDRDLESLLA